MSNFFIRSETRWCTPVQCAGLLLAVVLLAVPDNSAAMGRIAVEAGVGNYVDVVGVGIGSEDWKQWSPGQDWSLSLYGLARASFWRGHDHHNEDVVDLSAAPVLRLERISAGTFAPYVEASIGLHLLSHTRINETRQFSTAFQFGEFLGVGVTFGDNRRYDVALHVQHVSNGGIKNPNDGLTYGAVVFQYRFGNR